jgi:H+/Cl- antiporter ClcA
MNLRSLTRTVRGRRSRRAVVILTLVVLATVLLLSVAGAALAADDTAVFTEGNPNVQTAEGLEAPQLDYKFVWWTFILTFGLLILYYVVILRISNTEFKKIIDAHFGPKREGR